MKKYMETHPLPEGNFRRVEMHRQKFYSEGYANYPTYLSDQGDAEEPIGKELGGGWFTIRELWDNRKVDPEDARAVKDYLHRYLVQNFFIAFCGDKEVYIPADKWEGANLPWKIQYEEHRVKRCKDFPFKRAIPGQQLLFSYDRQEIEEKALSYACSLPDSAQANIVEYDETTNDLPQGSGESEDGMRSGKILITASIIRKANYRHECGFRVVWYETEQREKL